MTRITDTRRLCTLVAVVMAAVGTGCAPLMVGASVKDGIDLSAYRSYGWSPQTGQSTGDARLDDNPFFHGYLATSIDRQMTATGLAMRRSEPDLLVRYFAGVAQQVWPTGAEPPDASCRDCRVAVYENGTIVVDLVDARTRALVWRGWATGDVADIIDNQDALEQRVDRVVARIFEGVRRSR